ncbi:hypothetical protein FOG48_02913 [Hanseniaspora uvarum]|nr:hypothetical protein FOG48_02913 [Hanseniaspora uvarum]
MRIGKVLDLDQKAAFRTKTSIDIANRMINNRTKVSEFVKYTKNSPVLHLYRAKATLSIKEQADAQYKKDLKKISKEISNDLTEYFTPMSNYFNRRQHERNHRHANNLSKLPISIKNKAATDTEEHVNASSIKYTPSSEIRKISIGWDSNYGSLMSEFIEIYQSLEECGTEHIPVKLVDKVNFFFSQQLPANYLNTFFAYSFKTESDKVILKQIVTILMNTYTRSKVNNFTKCSGNIVDNIIFNHEVMYFFHSILYNILPRLGNVEVGEEFIDYFYKEILIKHCMSSNETVNYEKDAEVYKMLFKEKFEYHASTKELENNKDPETQFENAIEAL